MGSVDITKREQLDVLKKDGGLLLGAFSGSNLPGGKNGNGLLVIQESKSLPGKPLKTKEIILVRADGIECLNFRFPTSSLTDGGNLLHLFILTCQGPECEDLICNHGCYRAVSKDCRKILDETEMFTLHIEFPAPLNFVCVECFWEK